SFEPSVLQRRGRVPQGRGYSGRFRLAGIKRSFISQSFRWNFRCYRPVVSDAHDAVARNAADLRAWHVPFVEHLTNDIFPAALCNNQHSFLRLAEHDFIRRHPWLAPWDFRQIDFDTASSATSR